MNAEAFLLLNLANCTLVTNTIQQSGTVSLECASVVLPGVSEQQVYLVLRINDTEIPVAPHRVVRTVYSETGSRKYLFLPTEADPLELALSIALPNYPDSSFLEEIEIFESIIAQYADLQGAFEQATPAVLPNINDKADADELRGHLVLVDQDNGQVIGEFDQQFTVKEDPDLGKKGRENDPVVIELLDNGDPDANAMELFARAIPPDQQDWITKGATLVSRVISGSTTLLLSTISAGTSYYTSHSKPASQPLASSSGPPPLPPRAVTFLSSARTRKGLAAVHSVSGQAVKLSAKTVEAIDGMIKRAMGNTKKDRVRLIPSPNPSGSTLGPYGAPPPPPYSASSLEKPPLPPRRSPSPSPIPPALPPRIGSEQAAVKLTKKTRILLSADLILATMDHSVKRILDAGTQNVGTVVGHKYGTEAAESSVLMTGTARNIALVYIDLRGVGRRALLRRAGKEFVKGRLA